MLIPSRTYVDDTKRIAINFQDDDGNDVDPDGLTFKWMSPRGTVTTYVYGTDAQVIRLTTGDYHVDVTPDESGRWRWRWISTGSGKASATEGSIVVQYSDIEEGSGSTAYSG